MKINLILSANVLSFLAFIFIVSCKKEGTGGKATIAATIKHHGKIIPYAIVYIKYGAKESPGTSSSDYDANQTADANGLARFENLERGD